MKTIKNTTHFNIAEHLKTREDIQAFLKEVETTGNESDFIYALSIAEKAYEIGSTDHKLTLQ